MIFKILDSILPGSGTIIKKTIKYFEKGINAFVNALREDWDQLRNPSTESARTRSGVETINQTIAPRSTPHGEGDLISGLCWRAQGIGSKEGITPRR